MEHKIKNVSQRNLDSFNLKIFVIPFANFQAWTALAANLVTCVRWSCRKLCIFFFFFCLAELSASIVLAGATVNSRHSTASFNKFFQAVFLEFFQ